MRRGAAWAVLLLALMPPGALALGPLPVSSSERGAVTPMGIIELRDSTTSIDVLPFALVCREEGPRDAPSGLSFKPDLSSFRASFPDEFRGFIDAKAIWICFTVRSVASSRTWLLAAGPKSVESLSVYIVDPDGNVDSHSIDPSARSSGGDRSAPEYAFRLTIGPGQVKTVYMRFSSESLLSVQASLWDSFRYLKADERDSVIIGIMLGVVLAVFLYTLLIAVSLRDGAYAYYLIYLLGLLFLVISWNGRPSAFWWIGGGWARNRAVPFFSSVMGVGIAIFARRFLDMGRRSRFLSASLVAAAAGAPLFVVALGFFELRLATEIGIFLDMGLRLLVLAAAVYAVVDGNGRRERYFLVSWACALLGAVVSRLGLAGILSPALLPLWSRGEQSGDFAQILILTYGITDAIDAMRKEKDEGQRRSILLLEKANNVKEDFVIGTSLEFRSPLYGIVGLADALETLPGGGASKPEADRLAGLIRAEALRLLGSVANIAVYARLRNGDLALSAERASLEQFVQNVAAQASHIASGKDIVVETEVEDVELATDSRILGQILYNLFANALKRSPSGLVRIEGWPALPPQGAPKGGPPALRIRLAVIDSAPRLADEQLSRFLARGGSGDLEAVGPGLELLVARLLAERLGGSLSYSWSEGRGRFDLDFPGLLPAPLPARTAERGGLVSFFHIGFGKATRPAAADLSESSLDLPSRGLVLAYDEDPVFLEALKRYLEGRGYAVAPTLSADKAVALAEARRFDLVLLDASSPDRPGLAACARIRALRGLDELPIVVMTDRESAEAVEAAFRAGASDYLPKLSPNELLFARVDTHVALKRSMEEALETRRRIAELEKLKTLGVLAAGVAHEVNTPNNAVIRNMPVISEVWRELAPIVERLMRESEGARIGGWTIEELMLELPELLADTYNAGLQIKKIVEDLKDYARDSSSSPPEQVDLSAVAAYAARLLQPLVGRSTRRFVLDAPAGLPPATANFQKLTQVAVSILENALQSLSSRDAGVSLRTSFDPERSLLVLECEDEGVGIHPALLDKVFEPFFTTKRDSGGTGLGLSVAHGIVRDAGGEIAIDSRQGRGTRVRVVLPAMTEGEREGDGRRS
jgi:signal transduction histidine kinase